MKNKLLIFATAILFSITLASCDNNTTSLSNTTTSTQTTTQTTTTTTGTTTTTTTTTSIDPATVLSNVLNQLKSPISYDGKIVLKQNGIVLSQMHIYGYQGVGEVYINRDGTAIHLFKDETGYAVQKMINPLKNEVVSVPLTSSSQYVLYDEYVFNPFLSLTADDLVLNGNEITITATQENGLAQSLRYFAFYTDEMKEVKLTIDDVGTILKVELSSDNITYTADIVDKETINVPVIEAKQATSDHQKLTDLFTELEKGNYTVSYKSVYEDGTESIELTSFDFKLTPDGLLTSTGQGFLETDDGLVQVEVTDDNKLQGVSLPDDSVSILDDFVNPFSQFKAETFDYENNIFTLPEYIDYDYLTYILPEIQFVYSSTFGYEVTPGSLSITFNEDNTYTINYEYIYYTYNQDYELVYAPLNVTTVISNVGTTSLGYTLDDYIPKPRQNSWSDVEGASDLLETYSIPSDLLPFYLPDEADEWYIYSDIFSGDSLCLSFPTGDNLTAHYAEYKKLLEAKGWQSQGVDDYDEEKFTYTTSEGTILKIGLVQVEQTGQYEYYEIDIYLYAPEIASEISNYVNENIVNKHNYTLTGTLVETYTEVDADGNTVENGTVIENTLVDGLTTYVTEDAYYQYIETENGKAGVLYKESQVDGMINIDGYVAMTNDPNGELTFQYSEDLSMEDWGELYTWVYSLDDVFNGYTPLVAEDDYTLVGNDGQGYYGFNVFADVLSLIMFPEDAGFELDSLLSEETLLKISEIDPDSIIVTMDPDTKALQLVVSCFSESDVTLEDQPGKTFNHSIELIIEVTNIGTTTIDLDSLGIQG